MRRVAFFLQTQPEAHQTTNQISTNTHIIIIYTNTTINTTAIIRCPIT